MIDMPRAIKRINRRHAKEAKTPQVIYDRGGSYGSANLANVGEVLMMRNYPPRYELARQVLDPVDIALLAKARAAVRRAHAAEQKVFAEVFARGVAVTKEEADAAKVPEG
jgi:hypothetical protein